MTASYIVAQKSALGTLFDLTHFDLAPRSGQNGSTMAQSRVLAFLRKLGSTQLLNVVKRGSESKGQVQ